MKLLLKESMKVNEQEPLKMRFLMEKLLIEIEFFKNQNMNTPGVQVRQDIMLYLQTLGEKDVTLLFVCSR